MATGNPLLAVWDTTGTIRMFEFSAGRFVQIASAGGYVHNAGANSAGFAPLPKLNFAHDSAYFGIRYSPTLNLSRYVSFTPTLNVKASADKQQGQGDAGRGLAGFDAIKNVSIFKADALNGATLIRVGTNGLLTVGTNTPLSTGGSVTMRCFEVSPDGKFIIEGRAGTASLVHKLSAPGDFPTWGTSTELDTIRSVTAADWSPDSIYLCVGDGVTGGVEIHEVNPLDDSVNSSHALPVEDGLTTAVSFSPDQRMLAVGYRKDDTWFTVTYRRTGSFFVKYATLLGIGALLSHSADGTMLVDAQLKKAFSFDGSDYSALANAMDNIPAGVAIQEMSTHAVNPLAFGKLYSGAISDIIQSQVDYANIKFALLTEFASFDPNHATFAEVTGNGLYSVNTGQYPPDGQVLTGVAPVDLGDTYAVKADAVTRTIIMTNLNFRYGVAYDATNDRPLVFFDYTANRLVPKNTEMTLSFKDGNFITFAR